MNNPKIGREAVASAEARLISGRFQIGGPLAEQSVVENVRHSNIALILGDGIHGTDDANFAWIALEGAAIITPTEHIWLTASAAFDAVSANDLAAVVVLPIRCDVVNDVSIPPLPPDCHARSDSECAVDDETENPVTERYGELRLMRRPDPRHARDSFRSLSGPMLSTPTNRIAVSSRREDGHDSD